MIIISEVGNNHFGSMDRAKEMIRASIDNGADLIKGQAFDVDLISGSMTKEFYQMCKLEVAEYIELIDYARDLGSDMFYSIFPMGNDDYADLIAHMYHYKLSAGQSAGITDWEGLDLPDVFISIPEELTLFEKFNYAKILYASKYLEENPKLEKISKEGLDGYSDHTIGINKCVEAAKEYGAYIIEKHFTLEKNIAFHGNIFRDTVHGLTPKELGKLCSIIK